MHRAVAVWQQPDWWHITKNRSDLIYVRACVCVFELVKCETRPKQMRRWDIKLLHRSSLYWPSWVRTIVVGHPNGFCIARCLLLVIERRFSILKRSSSAVNLLLLETNNKSYGQQRVAGALNIFFVALLSFVHSQKTSVFFFLTLSTLHNDSLCLGLFFFNSDFLYGSVVE